ncbi:MAG: hypothetical protein U9Q97_07865 [Acidobacteriota bacterium]|nr:hypothetical protein [Acidobacteriota bacterium]
MRKIFIIIIFVLFSIYCSKNSSTTVKDEEVNKEVAETQEITDVEESKTEVTSKNIEEDEKFPTRALAELKDVLIKGEPYVNEESWEKLIKAASEINKIYDEFGVISGTLYNEMGKKIEAMSAQDEEKISKMQEEVKKKVEAARPTKEKIETVVKKAGFANLDGAVEIARRAPKVDFLYKLLMSTETSLKTADLGDLSKETYLTSQQKEGMKKMAELAKQAAKESIEALRKELKEKPYYTRKDIEIFLKYKERYDDSLQGIMLLQGQLD